MKHKKVIKRLENRIKAWEEIKPDKRGGYNKPGSLSGNK